MLPRKLLFAHLSLCAGMLAHHQAKGQSQQAADTALQLKEVVVTGFQKNDPRNTSLNIAGCTQVKIGESAPYNLSDALAKIPGVSQMTTGNAISKPVIRGLYGNRILVLYSGMRFDNQQWQDEHGLGLSQMGIDRVEVIKGPASLLYGSDAMGGVINIIDEKPGREGMHADAGVQLYANTRGVMTDAGVMKKTGNKYWLLRLGAESHADYSDGNNNRVLNSRNGGYYLKAGQGFERGKWSQENSYAFSYNQYGFIVDDLGTVFQADGRNSRSMAGPHHNVLLNLFSTQNTIRLAGSVLKLNGGVQSNLRMEDEGGGQISLNMHLLSLLQSLRWEKQFSQRTSFVLNEQYNFESNINYGGRIIVPDATMMEENLSGYFNFHLNKWIVETGAGVSAKTIHTVATRHLNNTPGDPVQPFTKNTFTPSGMAGVAWNPVGWGWLKANVATGFRAPNLAELSSNGVHEGLYRYEIGDPTLRNERNLNSDITAAIDRKGWFLSTTAYLNIIYDYVYLMPTSEKYYGFPVYRYVQQNAALSGAECMAVLRPEGWKGVSVRQVYTHISGVLENGGNLPYIPANKYTAAVRYERNMKGKAERVFAEPELVCVFDQNYPAFFETSTKGYLLVNLSSGVNIAGRSGVWRIGLVGTNLANAAYMDHLSRLKYYGLLNQGRNIAVTIRRTIG